MADIQKPQQFLARLEDFRQLNEKFIHLSFELVEPHRISFQAGQYVSVKVDEQGTRRSYSIVSRPDIEHGFELLVDISPDGIGSQFLQNLELGDEVNALAPLGQFVVPQDGGETALIFVATGSGIAPLYSMLLDQLQVKQDSRPMVLYWGMRYAKHLFWMDELQELAESFDNFSFYPVLSKPSPEWELSKGHVTDLVKVHDLPEGAGYYLCGNAAMIEDVKQVLQEKQVAPERIHHEKFY